VRATANAWITNVAIVGSIAGFATGAILIDRIGLAVTVSMLGAGLIISMVLVLRLPETRGIDLIRAPKGQRRATPQVPPNGQA
jgi:hypothetical protein